jgi:hypothetical protein
MLVTLLVILFIIKGLLLWPFYSKQGIKPLLLGLAYCLAVYPILSILYHETDWSFFMVYCILLLLDIFIYIYLLQSIWWKAMLVSLLLNTVGMIAFVVVNSF